jgi:ABC-type glycerol-3-phosphate transport system substrate-binding protein
MLPQRFAAVAVPVFQVAAVVLLIVVSWLVVQGELGSSQPTSGRFPTLGLLPSQEETRSTYLLANESNLTHDLNRALVNRFKTLHPEFKQLQVDFSSRPFEQALSAAPPADVLIWHADNSLPALVEKGMILNIDDTWLAEGWSESYPDYIQAAGRIDGNQYLLPTSYSWFAIYYYKPTFERYHLTPPHSWAEFLTLSETLQQNGITPVIHPNPQVWPALIWFSYLNMRLNGPDFHARMLQGQESLDTPEIKRVLTTWQLLLDRGYFANDLAFLNLRTAAQFMMDGNAAMILSTPGIMHTIPEENHDDFGFFRFPVIDPELPTGETILIESHLIPAQAEHPEAARAFLAYLGSTEAQAYVTDTFGQRLNRVPINSDTEVKLSSPHTRQGRDLVRQADTVIHFSYNSNRNLFDPTVHIESALNKFLASPENVDRILIALEELRQATNSN